MLKLIISSVIIIIVMVITISVSTILFSTLFILGVITALAIICIGEKLSNDYFSDRWRRK